MERLPWAPGLLEERELCRRFAPVRFPVRETLLNLAVAMLRNVPVAAAGMLAQKSLTRDLTFRAINGFPIAFWIGLSGVSQKEVHAVIGEIATVTRSASRIPGEESLRDEYTQLRRRYRIDKRQGNVSG
jgi:hypothetical protein